MYAQRDGAEWKTAGAWSAKRIVRGRKIEQEGRENKKKHEIQHKQKAERADFHAAMADRVYNLFCRADKKYHPLFF